MARNRQDIPKAEREAQVLRQARELFLAKGYRRTSITQIARACGIAPAAVFWYFPSKDDLFAAVLEQHFEGLRSEVDAAGGTPKHKLDVFLTSHARYRGLHRDAYERMEDSEAVRAVYAHVMQWLEGQLMRAISMKLPEGTDIGVINDTAHVMFEGMMISARRMDRTVSEFMDMLINVLVAAAVYTAQQSASAAPSVR